MDLGAAFWHGWATADRRVKRAMRPRRPITLWGFLAALALVLVLRTFVLPG